MFDIMNGISQQELTHDKARSERLTHLATKEADDHYCKQYIILTQSYYDW